MKTTIQEQDGNMVASGLRIFLDVLKSAEDKGSHVYIKGISDDVRAVFAITGFINLFEFK